MISQKRTIEDLPLVFGGQGRHEDAVVSSAWLVLAALVGSGLLVLAVVAM